MKKLIVLLGVLMALMVFAAPQSAKAGYGGYGCCRPHPVPPPCCVRVVPVRKPCCYHPHPCCHYVRPCCAVRAPQTIIIEGLRVYRPPFYFYSPYSYYNHVLVHEAEEVGPTPYVPAYYDAQ